jgi:hypothetical protein
VTVIATNGGSCPVANVVGTVVSSRSQDCNTQACADTVFYNFNTGSPWTTTIDGQIFYTWTAPANVVVKGVSYYATSWIKNKNWRGIMVNTTPTVAKAVMWINGVSGHVYDNWHNTGTSVAELRLPINQIRLSAGQQLVFQWTMLNYGRYFDTYSNSSQLPVKITYALT